jgi:hypothetical protein
MRLLPQLIKRWEDWAKLSDADYQQHKNRVIEESMTGLEKFIPDIRKKVDHLRSGYTAYG